MIGGIIGEGVFEFLSADAETAIRAHDEQVLGETIIEAGSAKDSADMAEKSAKAAGIAAGGATLKADDAKKKADSVFGIAAKASTSARAALALTGQAETHIANVDAKIATTEANVERVDEKFSFRELSAEKRSFLIDALRKAKNKSTDPVGFMAFMGIADGTTYGSEIAAAMNDPSTGWKAGEVAASSLSGTCKGVVLSIGLGTGFPVWLGDLQQALEASGIGGALVPLKDQPAGTVQVLICPKN